ncbi:hypothetical protein J421_6167 (plasmid) [Gemmatirosa kalamazoonensis]|uniref:Uncharacterized protein n=1 Tax=Gemmatirosa kalamazoonensis TaxID=861299 RepID=W0RTD7_9BACT|nr:hypothetical protein [Gemmatirosa kalamazoonensis]AHG93702.1 hypothetical protein J421_6167 [Gemmatirosa kalamazoonensis]
MSSTDRKLPAADPAAAERTALERTVLALTGTPYVPRRDHPAAARQSPDDHAPGTAESWERLAHTGERRVWAAADAALAAQATQAALAGAVGAYVRALRTAGVRLGGVLAAIASAVRRSVAPTISVGALDGVLRDAGQYGIEAYFDPR